MKNKLTESELEVLSLLWKNGPMTVREVHEEITKERDVGYTTTLKIMQIMLEKDILSRQKQGKGHLYSSKVDQELTQNGLLARMISTVFQGSAKDLVVQALGSSNTTQKELDEIRQYLEDLDKSSK